MATHSTEIMSEADPGEIVLIDKKKRFAQRLRDVEGVQRALDAVGSIQNIALSALAKNRRLLFVEGDEDFRTIRRFAKKLGFDELSSGVGITPLESGGFGSWQRVTALASGIADALGAPLMVGAIYDRDYYCDEELSAIGASLQESLSFSRILPRKEMENYLLIPNVIERAINRAVAEKRSRTGEDSPALDVSSLLQSVTEEMRDSVCAQLAAKRVTYLKGGAKDPSAITEETLRDCSMKWRNLNQRLAIVPGKEVLRRLREEIQAKIGVTLTLARLIDAMKKEEVPQDIVSLVRDLDAYRVRAQA